jgi:periplasmic copper chaperone A
MKRRIFTACFAGATMLLLASCGPTPQLRIHDATLTLSPVDSNPSAFHFKVLGGPKDLYLISVSSPSVIRSEMHDVGVDPKTGAVTMKPMDRVFIPADGKVEFKKGGKHVMMWGVNLVARRLGVMETEFVFNNGNRILVKAVVQELDGTEPDEKKALN